MATMSRRPQDKIYPAAIARRARWKPFGIALDPHNDEVTTIGEEIKLVLRYPNKCYIKEDRKEKIAKIIDDSYKKIVLQDKKNKRIIKTEEDVELPVKSGTYRPPMRHKVQKDMDERNRKSVIVVNDLHDVSQDDLHVLFGKYGTISRLHTINHDYSSDVRIAFIHYETQEQAEAATLAMNRRPINSVIIRVECAKPKI